MASTVSSGQVFRFGLFEADVAGNTLTRNGLRVKIQDQPFQVLILLLQRPGEIISREEFHQKLWPEGTFVDFDGSLNATLKKLRSALDDDSENPRFVETVPRKGYRFIAPVTLANAKAEPAPSPAGSAETEPEVGLPPMTASPPPRSRNLSYVLATGAILMALGFAWFGWLKVKSRTTSPAATAPVKAPIPVRKSVAVLGLHNISGKPEDGWLETAFSEMLSTELAAGEKLRLVPGEDVANLRLTSPWSRTDTLGPETTARIGTALNSDVLVLGSYASIEKPQLKQLRVDVRLQDARTGEILTELAEIGSSEDFFELISRVGAKLRERLGVPGIAESEEPSVIASLPSNPEAVRFYTLGIAKLRDYDAVGAKSLLEQAIKADPKFPVSHSMLARAWSQLGYEQKRKEEARKALDLSANLSRASQLQVEGYYYETMLQYDKAASSYQGLFSLFPDSLEYGLQLANAQRLAGHKSQALETVAALRRLPPQISMDPRIDLAEERAIPNDKTAQIALERKALTKADAQGKTLIYAYARKLECTDLIYSDHLEEGIASCEDASRIFLDAGNRLDGADTVRLIGDARGSQGHFQQAISFYEKALSILRSLGEEHEKTGAIFNNMAGAYANLGQNESAEQFYREAKIHFDQAGNQENSVIAMGNIADMLYIRGKLGDAAKLYQQAADIAGQRDPTSPGPMLYRLADLRLAQGNVKTAQDLATQAVAVTRPIKGAYQTLTGAMEVVGDSLLAQGLFADARNQYQQALDLRQKAGEHFLVAESQISLAVLAIEEGHPEQAEPLLREAIADFEKENEVPDATGAYTSLSRALLAQGKLADARETIQRAVELNRKSSDPALKLPAAIQWARIQMATAGNDAAGHRALANARNRLHAANATAKKLGYYEIECDARLALGELDSKNNPSLARSELETIEKETHESGLELLSRKAHLLVAARR